jgi:Fe2+ or Zn2+ uptake regulation protein
VRPATSPPVNAVTETGSEALATWEELCQSFGLLMTAPRRAILNAMSTTDAPRDAVTLLQAAREHHAATSMGTVYRLLRELEHHGLACAQARPHARLRWCLADVPHKDDLSRAGSNSPRVVQQQVQSFLHHLEKLGLAEASAAQSAPPALAKGVIANRSFTTTFNLLQAIAEHLGYRLVLSGAARSL